MAKKYRVTLTQDELWRMIARGKAAARKLAHARVLLQADEAEGGPARADEDLAAALNVSVRTIERVRQRFVEQGLAAALLPKPAKRIYARKLDGAQEAHLIALACSAPPEGKGRWTLRLLAEHMVELQHVDALSYETVARRSKKRAEAAPSGGCGAFRRSNRPSLSLIWRTCWRSTAAPMTPSVPSSAWTRRSGN